MSSQSGDELKPLDLPNRQEYTHRAHRFPGKFHPPLIAKIIEDHPEYSVIADPMCGSGTVAVESAVAGREALCVDIDPLSELMTRAKSQPVPTDELLDVGEEILSSSGPVPEEGELSEEEAREEVKSNLSGTRYCVPYNLLHWFEPYVAVGFSRLLSTANAVLEDESDEMTDAIHLCFAASVRRISRADPQPVSGLEVTKVRRQELEEGIDFDVTGTFEQVLNRLGSGYDELHDIDELGDVTTVHGNAKNFEELCEKHNKQPELVITSPPYCTAIEYHRRHRLEYEWLGLFNHEHVEDQRDERIETSRDFFGSTSAKQDTLRNLPEIKHEEISALMDQIEEDGKERKANLLRKYFLDAYDWIEQVKKALPEGGLFCMTVGPSTSYGHSIDTPRFLTDIAKEVGFEVVSEQPYKLTNNKMQYPTDGETTEMESLIKLRA